MRIKSTDFGGMSEKALWTYWKNYHRPSREAARALVGDSRPGFTGIASAAAAFASNLATGKGCVVSGDEQAAKVYFQIAESIREGMPADVRPRKPNYSTKAPDLIRLLKATASRADVRDAKRRGVFK